jgi:hypothetical protein
MVYYGDHKVRMSNGKKTEALSQAEAGAEAGRSAPFRKAGEQYGRLRAITEAKGTAYNAVTAQPSGAKTLTI